MGGGLDPKITLPAVKSGEIDEARIDFACANVLTQKFVRETRRIPNHELTVS